MKTVGYYSTPRLAEKEVQTIRQAFDNNLEWLDNSYPLVMVVNDIEDFPAVYDGGDSIDLRPNDSVDSYCFFEFNGLDVGNDNDINTYNLSVVFWCDLGDIDSARSQDYTWNLISDVLRILKDNDCYEISVNQDDPFERYDFELDSHLMRKYAGFKVDFTVYGDNFTCDFDVT